MPGTAQYTLQQVTAAAAAAQTTGEDEGVPPFLRRGIITPFRRDEKFDFANDTGIELIRSNVRQILGTRGPGPNGVGELPWLTNFGSSLHTLRHQKNNPVLEEVALVYVVEALQTWEPRVEVTEVSIEQPDRYLKIAVRFNVVDLNSAGRTLLAANVTETITL